MLISTFAFSVANILVKSVSHIPAFEVVFFRCFLASIYCYIGLKKAGADPKGSSRWLLLARGLFGTLALYLFFVTVQNIPLATAQTIQYLSPVFTTVIAIMFLNESVRRLQWLFYAIAFGGVLLIEQVDARVSPFFLIIGVMSAICSGAAYNLVRRMRETEHPLTVVFHFQLIGAIVGAIGMCFEWKTPQGTDWLILFLIGVFSQIGQIFLTHSLQSEPAASVAILIYSGLIYSVLAGVLLFNETLFPGTIIGILLVVFGVAASVYIGRRPRRMLATEITQG
jgi:drug/metabolite transporter (DMT)-like permease